MLWHSAANCKVSKFSSLFCIFLRNYWCWSWSNFDFCLCCVTLQPIVKFQNFFTFLHFSKELLVFIKHWFLFMLWHSAASCKVSQFFALFLGTTGLILINLSILFMLCTLQPIVKFQNFLTFLHFSQELLVWSWSNFDFCSCCGTLQPVAKFLSFLHFS